MQLKLVRQLFLLKHQMRAARCFVDNVEFTNLSSTESLNVTNAAVLVGSGADGVAELFESDDSHFAILADLPAVKNAPQVQVSFSTNATQQSPSQIDFAIELAANTVGLDYTIAALNFENGQFEQLGSGQTTTNDGSVTVSTADGNLGRFINDSNGQIVYRASWTPTSPTLFFPWEVRVDQVGWDLEQ